MTKLKIGVQTTKTMQPKVDLKVYDQKIEKAQNEEFNMLVLTTEDEQKAIELANRLNILAKATKEKKESITRPMLEALDNVRDLFKPREEKIKSIIDSLKSKVLEFKQTERAKAEKEKEKIDKKLEDGKISPKVALKRQQEVQEVEKTTRTEAGKMTMKKRKVVKIINPELLPREYLIPDEKKITQVAKAGVEIPGVVVEEVEEMSF